MSSTDEENSSFNPSRAIVLSEIPTRDKEKFYELLLNNEAKFFKDGNHYIASVRMLAPGVHKDGFEEKTTDVKTVVRNLQLPYEERLARLEVDGEMSINVAGAHQFDYSPYPRFVTLIADNNDTVRPKKRILSWVMKLIEDIYDTRWTAVHSKKDGKEEVGNEETDQAMHMHSFPIFCVRRLSLTMGLKRVVDQNCWDLMLNVDRYRTDYLEVELFARFLQEFYDHDVLLFFLYARSMVANVLHVNFRARWARPDQTNPDWMSYRECVTVSKIIFGEENEQMTREFLDNLKPHLVGQKSEAIDNHHRKDSRRIDITQFLHLAVVGYHNGHGGVENDDATRTAAFGREDSINDLREAETSQAEEDFHNDDDGEDIVEIFTNAQQDREREFLDVICASLEEHLNNGELSHESAETVLNKLHYELRVKINASLGPVEAFGGDIDAFDEVLVGILRDSALRTEFEDKRDQLLAEVSH